MAGQGGSPFPSCSRRRLAREDACCEHALGGCVCPHVRAIAYQCDVDRANAWLAAPQHPPSPLREGSNPANAVQDLDHLDPLDELPYLDAAEGEEEVDPDQRALPERVSP